MKCQGMQFAAHPAAQGGIDELVLPDAGQATEGLAGDGCSVVVAVSSQVLDGHGRVRKSGADQSLDLTGGHSHTSELSWLAKDMVRG